MTGTTRSTVHISTIVQQHEDDKVWRSWGDDFEKRRSRVNLPRGLIGSTKRRKRGCKKKIVESTWKEQNANSIHCHRWFDGSTQGESSDWSGATENFVSQSCCYEVKFDINEWSEWEKLNCQTGKLKW